MPCHTQAPKRYCPLWVTLHWVIALLIFAAFYLGISTEDIPLTEKVGILRWHMPLGITVLLLMLVRLVVRWRTPHPEAATVGNALLDKIGEWTHYLHLHLRHPHAVDRSDAFCHIQPCAGGIWRTGQSPQRSKPHAARVDRPDPGAAYPFAHPRSALPSIHPQG